MRVKNVVKVMNFHALIRVDAAKRNAVRYQLMEKEVMFMLDQIMNNRNFLLDKSILIPNPEKPKLTIYLGSDYGFCSNYNSQINAEIEKNPEGEKILIGKKLKKNAENVLLRLEQGELNERVREIEDILRKSIIRKRNSSIEVVFIRYLNASECKKDVHQIFPVEISKDADPANYRDDFMVEGKLEELLTELMISYLVYQIQIIRASGYASENVLRQNTTKESLKKIDEIEAEQLLEERRELRAKEFTKVIENFQKKGR